MCRNALFAVLLVCGMSFAPLAFGQSNNPDLVMASGWSVDNNESAAVTQAVEKMKHAVSQPEFLIAITTIGHDSRVIAKDLSSLFPKTKIVGFDSDGAVFTEEGVHKGEKGALALLGFEGGNTVYGAAIGDLANPVVGGKTYDPVNNEKEFATAVAMQTIREAMANAGKKPEDKPALIITSVSYGKEEYLVNAITSVFGKDARVVGGTSATGIAKPGRTMANGIVAEKGYVVGLVYTEKKVGSFFHGGFIAQGKSGTITKSLQNRIYEIDGKPAFGVYNGWVDGVFGELPKDAPVEIWKQAHKVPLAKVIKLPGGGLHHIITISVEKYQDGSLSQGTFVNNGDTVALVRGNPDILIDRAGYVARRAVIDGRIKLSDVAGGLHIYCDGAAYIGIAEERGAEHLGDIVTKINSELGGRPFVGTFSCGEQGSIKGRGAFHGNFMSSMAVFSK